MCLTTALEEMCGEAGANDTLRRRAKRLASSHAAATAAAAAGAASEPDANGAVATSSSMSWQPSWEQAQSMSADSLMPIVIYCRTGRRARDASRASTSR